MDQDREQRLRTRAYEIWEREGRHDGGHEAHWEQAEQELHDEDQREREVGDAPSRQAPAGPAVPAGPAGGKNTARAPRKKKESPANSKGKK